MAQTASVVTGIFTGLLKDPETGIGPVVGRLAADAGIDVPGISAAQIVSQNVSLTISERALAVTYPAVHVYSDRVRNLLTEKFRTFSGKVRTVAEVRVSQDRLQGIEDQLRLYADAVTQVLDSNRGGWGRGRFLPEGMR